MVYRMHILLGAVALLALFTEGRYLYGRRRWDARRADAFENEEIPIGGRFGGEGFGEIDEFIPNPDCTTGKQMISYEKDGKGGWCFKEPIRRVTLSPDQSDERGTDYCKSLCLAQPGCNLAIYQSRFDYTDGDGQAPGVCAIYKEKTCNLREFQLEIKHTVFVKKDCQLGEFKIREPLPRELHIIERDLWDICDHYTGMSSKDLDCGKMNDVMASFYDKKCPRMKSLNGECREIVMMLKKMYLNNKLQTIQHRCGFNFIDFPKPQRGEEESCEMLRENFKHTYMPIENLRNGYFEQTEANLNQRGRGKDGFQDMWK